MEGVRAEPHRVQPRVVRRALRHHAAPGAPAVQPDARAGPSAPHLSFDTAVSFVTNTNWQSYGGENTMSHLTSIGGLLVQHFASAAVGHGRRRRADPRHHPQPHAHHRQLLGRHRARHDAHPAADRDRLRRDPRRARASSRTSTASASSRRVEGVKQLIPGGPVAGWMAIKQLGSNGGGFFNVNSAHPFENPTQLANFFELYLTVRARVRARGGVRRARQGQAPGPHGARRSWSVIWLAGSLFANFAETNGNPRLTAVGANQSITADSGRRQHGGQGGAQRRVVVGDLGRLGHADVERLRQLHARQLDAARVARALLRHAAPAR